MSFIDIDGRMYSRNRSYELAMQPVSTYVSREEFEDAKKELSYLRRRRIELVEVFEKEKRELEERISDGELQMMLLPVDNIDRRIKELSYLINNARIVEKSSRADQEEILEGLEVENVIPAEQNKEPEKDIETSSIEETTPTALFFVKGESKVEANIGDRTPFYAKVENEFVGYNRLRLDGWTLVDESGKTIGEISKAWEIRNKMLERERAAQIQSAKEKYPNAYAPWTEEENERLLDLYSNQNKTLSQISEILGRTRNGISLQLKKLLSVSRLPIRKKWVDIDQYSLNPISITSINPELIPDEQMPDYLNRIEQMEEWFKSVKEYAAQQAVENGVCYDGYEVETKYKITFSDTKRAMATIKEKLPELFDSCVQLKSCPTVMNILRKENRDSDVAEFVVQKEQNSLVKSKTTCDSAVSI